MYSEYMTLPGAMNDTKCDLAFSQDSLGTKEKALAGRGWSQGDNKFKYFWVSAAPLLGIEYLEDGDHGCSSL